MEIPELDKTMVAAVKDYADTQGVRRNQLSFRIQFLPFVSQYITRGSDICFINPIVPFGGLTEYSKKYLHEKINQQRFPRTVYKKQGDSSSVDLNFPLYFKADSGERGQGVVFCPDQAALLKAISTFDQDFSLQEASHYNKEFCVQFYKIKGRFHIASITQREMPTVVGDGISTLLELIQNQLSQDHTQSVVDAIISTLRQEEPDRLDSVPDTETIETVIRKASIDNGTKYNTLYGGMHEIITKGKEIPQQRRILQETISTILQPLKDGLDCGRFDLTADSIAGLQQGTLHIIEVNAGGAVPTHVYDDTMEYEQIMHDLNIHYAWLADMALQRKGNKTITLKQKGEFYAALKQSVNKKGVSFYDLFIDMGGIAKQYIKNKLLPNRNYVK